MRAFAAVFGAVFGLLCAVGVAGGVLYLAAAAATGEYLPEIEIHRVAAVPYAGDQQAVNEDPEFVAAPPEYPTAETSDGNDFAAGYGEASSAIAPPSETSDRGTYALESATDAALSDNYDGFSVPSTPDIPLVPYSTTTTATPPPIPTTDVDEAASVKSAGESE